MKRRISSASLDAGEGEDEGNGSGKRQKASHLSRDTMSASLSNFVAPISYDGADSYHKPARQHPPDSIHQQQLPTIYPPQHAMSAPVASAEPNVSCSDQNVPALPSPQSQSPFFTFPQVGLAQPDRSASDHGIPTSAPRPAQSTLFEFPHANLSDSHHDISAPSPRAVQSTLFKIPHVKFGRPSLSDRDHDISAPSPRPVQSTLFEFPHVPFSRPNLSDSDHNTPVPSARPVQSMLFAFPQAVPAHEGATGMSSVSNIASKKVRDSDHKAKVDAKLAELQVKRKANEATKRLKEQRVAAAEIERRREEAAKYGDDRLQAVEEAELAELEAQLARNVEEERQLAYSRCEALPGREDSSVRISGHAASTKTHDRATDPTSNSPINDTTDLSNRQPLAKLPAELRNAIYELVLVEDSPIQLNTSVENSKRPALLGMSRAIRKDTLEMYYSRNTFRATLTEANTAFLCVWLNRIGPKCGRLLKHLIVECDGPLMYGWVQALYAPTTSDPFDYKPHHALLALMSACKESDVCRRAVDICVPGSKGFRAAICDEVDIEEDDAEWKQLLRAGDVFSMVFESELWRAVGYRQRARADRCDCRGREAERGIELTGEHDLGRHIGPRNREIFDLPDRLPGDFKERYWKAEPQASEQYLNTVVRKSAQTACWDKVGSLFRFDFGQVAELKWRRVREGVFESEGRHWLDRTEPLVEYQSRYFQSEEADIITKALEKYYVRAGILLETRTASGDTSTEFIDIRNCIESWSGGSRGRVSLDLARQRGGNQESPEA